MDNQILIGDFIKLTGSTLKTILYYHKIGLLKEPRRSIFSPAQIKHKKLMQKYLNYKL